MKKSMFFIVVFVVAIAASVTPTKEVKAQVITCWWNPVDQDCCENGSCACAGGCDGGAVLQ